jgi:hypothetical protein
MPYQWTFILDGAQLNFAANTLGGWQAYGDCRHQCHAPAEERLAKKLLEVRQAFVSILPPGSERAEFDPVGCGFDRVVSSNTDTNSAMVSFHDSEPPMFALTVVLCPASVTSWLDLLKFARANRLRFTVDIGFVGFPPFTSHYESVSYDEFIAADFMERRAVFSADASLRVLPEKG